MSSTHFNAASTGLKTGINLIEASAGTGKTYAIAMLVLRFVLEIGMPIGQVLVVTFTKAATEELKSRIRARLLDAKQVLQGNKLDDDTVEIWLQSLSVETDLIRRRLETALLDIDHAGIFTIHGFCQRMLREHALESGQLFDAELTDDLAQIKQACADDFWRRQIYPRSAWEVGALTVDYPTPDSLLASVDRINGDIPVYPGHTDLLAGLAQLKLAVDGADAALDSCLAAVLAAGDKFNREYRNSLTTHGQALKNWLQGGTLMPKKAVFILLTAQGLRDGLNGNKFKGKQGLSADERKNAYLAELGMDPTPFDTLASALKNLTISLRRALLETLRTDLDRRLQQLNVLSFDNLIARLFAALQAEKGGLLKAQLRQRFQAALIDEFQDTDNIQWEIFSAVFAVPSHYLYLIGDPKQAIYKFRGADIYAYLQAKKQAGQQYDLELNWRSHPELVTAVNALFRREQAFKLAGLHFFGVKAAKKATDGYLQSDGQDIAPMMLWQLPESDNKQGCWQNNRNDAANHIMLSVVNEIVALLIRDYRLQPANKALQPRDIAILVRTNGQARKYQDVLRQAGVPAVLNNTESVFQSQEAVNLYILLQAVANPSDSGLLKQALALDWFGLDGQALYRLSNDELLWDGWVSRFWAYSQDWQNQGLMAMMRQLLAQENISLELAKTGLAERRLTNLHHLLELLQQAAIEGHLPINKTLDWLRHAISNANRPNAVGEDQQIRLESDDDAVQIITMHRAKGLEYAVVFCPCLWQRNSSLNNEKKLVICHENGRMVADLGSADFEKRRRQALDEELAEDLRIFYVAVTRAKYRCYLAWADARTAGKADKANNSAMAWLLSGNVDFAAVGFSGQQELLQAFCNEFPATFAYRLLPIPTQLDAVYARLGSQGRLQSRQLRRTLFSHWQMSSYTALSALSQYEAPELPEDKSGEQHLGAVLPEVLAPQPEQLPLGAVTGNVVHDLLEHSDFVELANGNINAVQRNQACQRFGLKLQQPHVLDSLLQQVVTTPLSRKDFDFCLRNLPPHQCLKEMPFYLAMQPLDTMQINRILAGAPVFQALDSKALQGYLTGFIDLICCYKGRYYVMDYKTNTLPDYSEATLAEAMREHNYGLQYWLYTVVLHLYLQNRLPDYHYERYFGGVRYLFVRGMQAGVPMSGVFRDRPDLDRVEALANLFSDKMDGHL